MKLFSSVVCLVFLASFLAVSAFAQKTETEGELFAQISKLTQTKKAEDEDKAYALGKTFIERFGANNSDDVKKVRDFMNTYQVSFVVKRIGEGKAKEAFVFGKDALAQSPDNSQLSMTLANAGYEALVNKKDKSFGQDSILFAKQTIKLFEENKLPASFQPFLDRDEATAMMYYIVGSFSVDSNLKEAAHSFYKALQYNTKVKNNSYPYYIIAFNYEKEYEKAAKEFEAKYANSTTAGSGAMQSAEAKLEKLLNNMQDAYARAIKLGEAENAPKVGEWKKRYNQLYEFIKGSSAGSAEYLANVLTTPMPDPNAL